MRPEQAMWRKVSKAFGPEIHATRVEASTGEVETGVPDVVFAWRSRMRWIELKVWPEPVRPSQRAWALTHDQRMCDPVLLLCEVPRQKIFYLMKLYLYDRAQEVDDLDLLARTALWSGPLSKIREILSII